MSTEQIQGRLDVVTTLFRELDKLTIGSVEYRTVLDIIDVVIDENGRLLETNHK